jgi:hypothetical protein
MDELGRVEIWSFGYTLYRWNATVLGERNTRVAIS